MTTSGLNSYPSKAYQTQAVNNFNFPRKVDHGTLLPNVVSEPGVVTMT